MNTLVLAVALFLLANLVVALIVAAVVKLRKK